MKEWTIERGQFRWNHIWHWHDDEWKHPCMRTSADSFQCSTCGKPAPREMVVGLLLIRMGKKEAA